MLYFATEYNNKLLYFVKTYIIIFIINEREREIFRKTWMHFDSYEI